MSDTQKPAFLALTNELGLNPDDMPVSCPIPSDGSYGGAMGPSQFMPRTWWDDQTGTGYKLRVTKITGHNPPSPWDNLDAFSATALYAMDAMSSCRSIYQTLYSQEACAAARYYAGGNWRKHMNGYGDKVAARAEAFQRDIDILDVQ